MSGIRPIIKTDYFDPTAIGIIELFYDRIRLKRENDQISDQEQQFFDTIEFAYREDETFKESRVHHLLDQVYSILNEEKTHTHEDEMIFESLQKVILLGEGRDQTFSDYFNEVEKIIKAVKRLDFNQKVPTVKVKGNRMNLLSYSSLSLNMIIDTLKFSVVSRNAVNTLLSKLPETILCITDKKGQLRFVNSHGEKLFGLDKYSLPKKHFKDYLLEFEEVQSVYSQKGSIQDRTVHLKTIEQKEVPATLIIPTAIHQDHELEEMVFILQMNQPIDLRMDSDKDIKKIHHIIGLSNEIEKATSLKETQKSAELLKELAWGIKESLQGTLQALVQKKPKNHAVVEFGELLEQLSQKLNAQFPFTAQNNFSGHFFGDSQQIAELMGLVILFLYKFCKLTKLELETKEAPFVGVFILLKVSGQELDLKPNELKTVTEGHLKDYKGFVEVLSFDADQAIVQICLQH